MPQQARSCPKVRQKIAGGIYSRAGTRFSCDSLGSSFGAAPPATYETLVVALQAVPRQILVRGRWGLEMYVRLHFHRAPTPFSVEAALRRRPLHREDAKLDSAAG